MKFTNEIIEKARMTGQSQNLNAMILYGKTCTTKWRVGWVGRDEHDEKNGYPYDIYYREYGHNNVPERDLEPAD